MCEAASLRMIVTSIDMHVLINLTAPTPPVHAMAKFNNLAPSDFQLRPQYYLVRSDTTATPLIPADELPFDLRLRGISRVLRPDEVNQMTCVGSTPSPKSFYYLEKGITLSTLRSNPPSSPVLGSSFDLCSTPPSVWARHSSAGPSAFQGRPTPARDAPSWRSNNPSAPAQDVQAKIDAVLAADSGQSHATTTLHPLPHNPPSGVVPDQERKKYCTHWLRTSTCDYTQQGCMFKHELPPTEAEFEKLGLKPETCRWMLEKEVKGRFDVPDYLKRKLRLGNAGRVVAGGKATITMPVKISNAGHRNSNWIRTMAANQPGDDDEDDSEGQDDHCDSESKVSNAVTDAAQAMRVSAKDRKMSAPPFPGDKHRMERVPKAITAISQSSTEEPGSPLNNTISLIALAHGDATIINPLASSTTPIEGDLISLEPETPSSTVSDSSRSSSSAVGTPSTPSPILKIPRTTDLDRANKGLGEPSNTFIPHGEKSTLHITTSRARRSRTTCVATDGKTAKSRQPDPEIQSLEEQIQALKRAQAHLRRSNGIGKTGSMTGLEELRASKHVHTVSANNARRLSALNTSHAPTAGKKERKRTCNVASPAVQKN